MSLKKMVQSVIGLSEYQIYEDRRRTERVTMFFIVLAVAAIAFIPSI